MFVAPLFWNCKTLTCIVPELFNVLVAPLKVKLLVPVVPALRSPPDKILVVKFALIVGAWSNWRVPPISSVTLFPAAEFTLFCMVTVTPGATHILLLYAMLSEQSNNQDS